MMWKSVPAALAAAFMVMSPAAAQQGAATDGVRAERGERARLSPDDVDALVDARIAALRAGLKLNAEQEKNWPPVETAIRDLARQRAERLAERRTRREARAQQRDPIERLRATADAMGERAAGLKRLADASEPLYRSLDDGQKRRLQVLARRAMQPRHGLRRW